MDFSRIVLKVLNALVSIVVALCLCIAGAYSVYALWDNNQIYEAVEDVQQEMLELKPEVEAESEDNSEAFAELLAINPDVCAWITIDNTKINYPVLQGETNLTYINTDVYGNFSISGSIFMDSRNSSDFSDAYNLFYGHHITGGRMFGDIDRFKKKDFLKNNTTGTLITLNGTYDLEIYACIVVSAADEVMFNSEMKKSDIPSLLKYVERKALFYNEEASQKIREADYGVKFLTLSTCSYEFTDARSLLVTVMHPRQIVEADE